MITTRSTWAALLVVLCVPILLNGCPCPPPCPPEEELGTTIRLVPGEEPEQAGEQPEQAGSVVPETVTISRSWDKGNHVSWINETSVTQKVIYQPPNWPFMEPYEEIVIEPNARSPWYTMADPEDVPPGAPHPYDVTPLLDEFPPGGPVVTDGP